MVWRAADAKERFTELVSCALAGVPQVVVLRRNAVVVVAKRDYDKLTGRRPDFKQFLLGKGPSFRGLDLRRDKSPVRNVSLSCR